MASESKKLREEEMEGGNKKPSTDRSISKAASKFCKDQIHKKLCKQIEVKIDFYLMNLDKVGPNFYDFVPLDQELTD